MSEETPPYVTQAPETAPEPPAEAASGNSLVPLTVAPYPTETAKRPNAPNRLPGEPDWSALPPQMSPAEIGAATGISTDQARTNGNRDCYGKKIETMKGRRKLTFYRTANVAAFWRSQNEPLTIEERRTETTIQPNEAVSSLIVSLETIAAGSKRSETDADTIARLVRQNEKLVGRVGELERELREASEQWEPVMFGLFRKRR